MKKCPNCGYVMENDKAKYCRKCGTRQPDQIIVTDDSPSAPVTEESPSVPVAEEDRRNDGILLGEFRKDSHNDEDVQTFLGENHQREDAISLISSRDTMDEPASTSQSVPPVAAPQPQQDSFYLWAKIIIIIGLLFIAGILFKSFAGNRVDMMAGPMGEITRETPYIDGILGVNGVPDRIISVELACDACGACGD